MKSYKREEVLKMATEYFKGDELAAGVWINKYALKDSNGNIYEKTPDDMHERIANELYRIESKYPNPTSKEEIFETIKDFKYIIPQGSPMSGIGNNLQTVSLSNCFVVGNEADSYGGLMLTDQEQAQLMKRRGGVGHDLSHIRPKGTDVKNSALSSTGIVPFMERFSNTTREVAQDGRRGALMLSCSIEHPDSEDFIDAKMETGKVTGANVSVKITDEFMKSVNGDGKFIQKYPINSENPKIFKEINSKKLWRKIINNAWNSAEPGILFWDTVERESIPDLYSDYGYKTTSTNPCVVGDTLIAVADGRNYVKIKDLEKEGKDVPVYTLDNKGNIKIRKMRNPRITGYNQKIYKVNIEGGHSIRVTGNHKFRLKDGTYKQAEDLNIGDSLHVMTKWEASFKDIRKYENEGSDYYWLNNGEFGKHNSEHRMIYEELTGNKIEKGFVIHHKDFNSKNNKLDNLELLSKQEHDKKHGKLVEGENNPNFSNISNDDIILEFKKLTKKLKRRISYKDWRKHSKENNFPQYFSNWRKNSIGTVATLSKKIALELGYEYVDVDPRLVKTYEEALKNGYDSEINENKVLVKKICEECGEEFQVNYFKREISFCSHNCSLNYINKNEESKRKRSKSVNETYSKKSIDTKNKQVKIYSDLKFKLGRIPSLKEWENSCKEEKIPYRLKTKYGFKNYKEICENSDIYNHKVVSVEIDGNEDVYNGTVDEYHNFFTGFEEKTKNGKRKFININQLNCGEIPLCPYDSCRLLLINLYSYVENPFTDNSKFNFELFKKHVSIAMRYMDDIVDLEIEKVDKILEKIDSDPEDENIKKVEKELWYKIKKMAELGRRTGLGVTAEGDMLASMGFRYGSQEGNNFSELVHKTLAIEAYKSSCLMAKERGKFPIYDYNREVENPFIKRLINDCPELDTMLRENGRRNISLLTVAPAGTTSMMSQTTSGIEPVFLPVYRRRRKVNPNDKDVKITFVDEVGDSWEEYNVFHHKFLTWLEVNGYNVEEFKNTDEDKIQEIVEKSPYYKATSNDVDWVSKIELQGKVQKYVDHSISVTCNLPNNVDVDIVDKVYRKGWEVGCKGVTVYRDGSRSGVLISSEKKDKKDKKEEDKTINEIIKDSNAPRRPKKLECDIVRFSNKGEKWIGFIGVLDERPYEIFTGLLESFPVPNYLEKGYIKKYKNKETGEKRYDFVYIDKEGYEQEIRGLSRAFKEEYWDIAKMTSAVLRHGMPIPSVINLLDTLHMDGQYVGTWKAGVKRMLKKYIKDGEDLGEGKNICPECGQDSLTFQEGCVQCINPKCGFSKCG
jgi:ribonucleotide reductase alpha subunit